MYIVPDLLEQIFLKLPLKSILRFRTVSKQWRSILRSKRFVEKHKSLQKSHRKILASYDCDCGGKPSLLPESRFEGDEEIVFLHCNATRPSMTCDGLVCFPEQDWFVVLNPLTKQLQRFPSGLNSHNRFGFGLRSMRFCPEKWAMGFGRDKVTGKFKVVRMCFYFWERRGQRDPVVECGVLDVDTGEWRKLNPPRHVVNAESKSVCVNGSIYWLQIGTGFKILALDLNKEKFHGVPGPGPATSVTRVTQIVNLEDRLAIATTKVKVGYEWILEISTMDTVEKLWSKAYSISLAHRVVSLERWKRWFTPVAVSKQGNLVFCDNQKRLFKYYPRKDEIRCLSLDTCVISSYVENVGTLPLIPSHPYPRPVSSDSKTRVVSRCPLLPREPSSWLSKVLQWNEFRILDILFASLVVVGYIFSPH